MRYLGLLLRGASVAVLFLFLAIVGVQPLTFTTAVAATSVAPDAVATAGDDDNNERTCSLDPSTSNNDCSATAIEDTAKISPTESRRDVLVVTHRQPKVISLNDDNFDTLTHTSTPSTWLIMFKTNSCGICKKSFPILEALSRDADIVRHNCNNGLDYDDGEVVCNGEEISADATKTRMQLQEPSTTAANGNDDEIPIGPIYIATIDAGWSGRDTTKRFEVDATPTIIVLRNEGYNMDNNNNEQQKYIDSRSYYIYRGQRAKYPLRSFVSGGYALRKRMTMPPPLSDNERKPVSSLGQMYEYIISPSAKWAGGILVKIILAWFVFIGVLGLFLRIHNYAWGGEDDRQNDDEKDIEKEKKARGREDYNATTNDEKIERRQQMMWERKEKNREIFAAKREARDKAKIKQDVDNDDEKLEGVGVAVKKSDAKKILRELKSKKDVSSKS